MSDQVLVIDDEQDAVDNIVLGLRMHDITCRGEINPKIAIESFRADPTDVVIVDYLFPPSTGLTGINVIAEMQTIKPFTAFILISGWDYRNFDEQIMTEQLRSILKAERYIRKPINLDKLVALIHGTLQRIENVSEDWKSIAQEHVNKGGISSEDVRQLNDTIKDALTKSTDESHEEQE